MRGTRGVLHNGVKKCFEVADRGGGRQGLGPLTVHVYSDNGPRWLGLRLEEYASRLHRVNDTKTWCRFDLRR